MSVQSNRLAGIAAATFRRTSEAIRFGDFWLDRETQRLSRAGAPVSMDPRAWDVLCYLVERAGALVSREEILAAAWPGVVVSDAALSQAVQRVRRALGDGARQPRYIETVHRRGFRFIAALESSADEASITPLLPETDATPFIGRESERREVAAQLDAARAGTRQIAFVEGEPGIGKTSLVNALLAERSSRGMVIVRAQCVQQEGSTEPYLAVLEALDHLARAQPDTLAVLNRHAPTWLAQIPWLLSPDEARGVQDSASDSTRARMLREMARALEVVAEAQPVLMVLEDLHWADPATIDLLASVAQRTEPTRLMVLGTYQPARAIACGHPVVGLVRRLSSRGACKRFALELFTPDEVQTFLARRLSTPGVAESLARRLHVRSEGNPLFLVTIVDHLVERGLMARGAAADIRAEDLNDIPANLRGMIELHLDSVDAEGVEILEAASAAALEFRTASVAAALGKPGADGIEAVEKVCEQLVTRWHLLREAGVESWPDGTHTSRYVFRHDLYRQVLYERLPGNRRRRFHQRIGDRLEKAFANDPSRIASELAAHFDQSGDDASAVTYFLLAARQARRRFADPEAAAHFDSALRRAEHLPAGPNRDLYELQARLGLVRTRLMMEQHRPADEERNLSLIQTLAERITEGPDLFRLQLTLAQIHILRSLPDLAQPIVDRLVTLADRRTSGEQAEAFFARGAIAMMQGRLAAAADDFLRTLAMHEEADPPTTTRNPSYEQKWRDAGSRIHVQLAGAFLLLGAADRALDHIQRTIDICQGRIHPSFASGRSLTAAGFLCLRGDLELARAASDRGLAIAEEHQFANQVAVIQPQRLWLAFQSGDQRDPRQRIEAAWQSYLRARDSAATPVGPLFLLDACRMVGAPEEGLAIAVKTWADTRSSGLRWYDAELERLRGELILLQKKRGASAEADACFRRALAVARSQGAKWYELRAAMSRLRLQRRRAGEKEARADLARVCSDITEGHDTRDLRDAAALLAR